MQSYSHEGMRHYMEAEFNITVTDPNRHWFADVSDQINHSVNTGFGEQPIILTTHEIYHYQSRRTMLGVEKLAAMGHPRDLNCQGIGK